VAAQAGAATTVTAGFKAAVEPGTEFVTYVAWLAPSMTLFGGGWTTTVG